jgi:glycosyltransferase involved in cell wall biosynthesis
MAKVSIYHFHNGSGGGVLSIIRNLLLFRQHDEIENHVIYTINKEQTPTFFIPGLEGAASEQVFYYSPKWNFYYTSRQLAKLLPENKVVIVAHDWLELGMVSHLGLQNTVIQVLHGDFDYYYDLAKLHTSVINAYVCVSGVIARKLKTLLPAVSDDIHSLHFPVPDVDLFHKDYQKVRCVFFVRDLTDERKQAFLLPLIDQSLLKKGISIEWHIAGGGIAYEDFFRFWPQYDSNRIFFFGTLDVNGIKQLLKSCTLFVLPSLAEGFPVAVVEAMKHGLVPLVSKWGGAIDELIKDGYNGFFLPIKDIEAYANCIYQLVNNPEKISMIGLRARQRADILFNPVINTKKYEDLFLKTQSSTRKNKRKFKAYGSRLDNIYFPNILVNLFRRLVI